MLIVYSEVLSKAPRFLQTHFMYNARQYWGFKAPYSEDWEVVEKLAFVFFSFVVVGDHCTIQRGL